MNDKKIATITYTVQTAILMIVGCFMLLIPYTFHSYITNGSFVIPYVVCIFISLLSGYLAIGSIVGSQHNSIYNVYKTSTELLSRLQLVLLFLAMIDILLAMIT